MGMSESSSSAKVSRQCAAVVLIIIVDLLWTASNELTQSIFHNASYNHPFFLSYFNTSMFTIYALFFLPLFFHTLTRFQNDSIYIPDSAISSQNSPEQVTGGKQNFGSNSDCTDIICTDYSAPSPLLYSNNNNKNSNYENNNQENILSLKDSKVSNYLNSQRYETTSLIVNRNHLISGDDDGNTGNINIKESKNVNINPKVTKFENNNTKTAVEEKSININININRKREKSCDPKFNKSTHSCCIKKIPARQLSIYSTFQLSFLFCLIWFGMTFTFNLSLNYTSVSSNSIISNMSCPFCFILSLIFLHKKSIRSNSEENTSQLLYFEISFLNIIGILITVAGSCTIGYLDNKNNNDDHNDSNKFGFSSMVIGDILALLSSFIYSLYVTLLKKKIGDESRVNMFLFFGFIGVINMCILWPFVIILNALKWEKFDVPSSEVLLLLVCNGLLTVFSDYLWAQSILLSTPLVATVGLSLQMPIAMAADEIFRNETHSVVYWLSAMAVWIGFIFVNLDLKKQTQLQYHQSD